MKEGENVPRQGAEWEIFLPWWEENDIVGLCDLYSLSGIGIIKLKKVRRLELEAHMGKKRNV